MPEPPVIYAGLELLDRQLVDKDGVLCGKVDDLELDEGPAGTLYVSAIVCGPGALLRRAGRGRLGDWLQRFTEASFPWRADPGRVPFDQVTEVGNHISLSADHRDLATFAGERWVRDHVIGPIPGSGHHADG
jgi:sporulation protein YlmC with PRC-barrel domain